jgi:hypothetical protein
MKDLKSMLRKKRGIADLSKKIPENQKDAAQSIEKQAQQYAGKSQDELMSELKKSVEAGKADGSFSNETMEEFIKNVSPMMDKEQKEKLIEIAKMFKD